MPTLLVDAGVYDIVRRLLPENVRLEIFDAKDDSGFVQGEALAAVSLSGQRDVFNAALAKSPFAKATIFEVDPEAPTKFSEAIIRFLMDKLNAARRDIGNARMATAQLRMESMGAKAQLREIEHLLYNLGNPQLSNALVWHPTGKMLQLESGNHVSQLLPISVVGLTAIDLWFPQTVMNMTEDFSVAIEDTSGHIHPMQAATPDMGLETGWLRFTLAEPIQGIHRDCHLRIEMSDESRLSVGLAQAVPDPKYRPHGMDGQLADETLAVRAWHSLGGVRLPDCSPAISGHQAITIKESRFMPASSFPKPEVFAMPPQITDYVSTMYWESEDAILVHPSRSGAVCSIIRDVNLAGLSHISALVTVGHARSPNLNFAIGVAPHGEVDEDGFWQRRLGLWVNGLPPHGWAQAHCIPVTPITGRADLLLAVSLAADVPNNNSWGLFRGLRVSYGKMPRGGIT